MGQLYCNPTELPDEGTTLDNFMAIYNDLKSLPLYKYYEIYKQPLDITSGIGKYFKEDGELSYAPMRASCVQISDNVLDDFDISVIKGRSLDNGDYSLYENAPIPVLMGYEYLSLYSLNEKFTARYLFTDYEFLIIGFLKEETIIHRSTGSISLDRHIIIPSFAYEYLPESNDDFATHKIHYANKTSGIIRTRPEDYAGMCDLVLPKLSNTLVGDYSWHGGSIHDIVFIWNFSLSEINTLSKLFSKLFTLVYIPIYLFVSYRFYHEKLNMGMSEKPARLLFILLTACVLFLAGIGLYISIFLYIPNIHSPNYVGSILLSILILVSMSILVLRSKTKHTDAENM